MKLATIENWPGKNYEILGLVKGTVVQSKNLGKDFMAGMKTLVGGEIVGYTEMIVEARAIATSAWSMKRRPSARTPSSTSAMPPPPSCRAPRRSSPTAPPSALNNT